MEVVLWAKEDADTGTAGIIDQLSGLSEGHTQGDTVRLGRYTLQYMHHQEPYVKIP